MMSGENAKRRRRKKRDKDPSSGAPANEESLSYSRDCIECDAEHCNQSAPEKRCARCHTVYYCSAQCQKSHWKVHKPYCIDFNVMREKLAGIIKEEEEELDNANVDTNVECAICLESKAMNPIVVPRCKHVFCFSCLESWRNIPSPTNSKAVCPLCRTDIESDHEIKLKRARLNAARAQGKGLSPEKRNEFFDLVHSDIDDALQDDEEDLQTLFTKAEVLCMDGRDSNAAINVAKKIIDINDKRTEIANRFDIIMAQIENAMSIGDEDEAERLMAIVENEIDDIKKFSRINPFDGPLLLAQAYTIAGEWNEAKEVYKGILMKMDSPDVGSPQQQRKCWMGLCRCAYELGDYDRAQSAGSVALEMNRHFYGVHKYIALAQKESGDLDAAINTMNRAVLYETPWDDDNISENKKLFEVLKSSKE